MRGAVLCRRVGFRNIKGTVSERSGSNDRRAGESLIRVGAVGIRIWKTSPRFPNSWAGGQTFPRTHNFQTYNQATTLTRATFPPSQDKSTLPIPPNRSNIDLNSHLGRAQLHREGQNVTKKGARPEKDVGVKTGKAGGKFHPGRCGGRFYAEE